MNALHFLQLPHPRHRPTADQFRFKKTVANELDHEIESIESEIKRLKARVQLLQSKKANLVSYFSPLRCLPPEILREIIWHCRQRGVKLTTLEQICGNIREVTIGMPSIWNKIRVQLGFYRTEEYKVFRLFR
jgi:hypothetical protein